MSSFESMKIVELNSLDKAGIYSFCNLNDFSDLVNIAGHVLVPVTAEDALTSFIDSAEDYLYEKLSSELPSEEDRNFLNDAISDEIEELTKQDILLKYIKEYTNEIYIGLLPQDVRGFYYLVDNSPDYTKAYEEIFNLYKNEILVRVVTIKTVAGLAAKEKVAQILERRRLLPH